MFVSMSIHTIICLISGWLVLVVASVLVIELTAIRTVQGFLFST